LELANRKRVAAGLGLAVACALGACTAGAVWADPVTLTYLTDGSAGCLQTTNAFFKAFEQTHPDIKINVVVGGLDMGKYLMPGTALAGEHTPAELRSIAATLKP